MVQPASKRLVTEASFPAAAAPYRDAASVIILGDSITNNNSITAADYTGAGLGSMTAYAARGYWTWASIEIGHRCKLLQNAGVSGETAQQIALRVPAVAAQNPGIVVVEAGRNSIITNSDSAATIIGVVRDQIVTPLRKAGCRVVLTTITPRDTDSAGNLASLFGFNSWAKEYARVTPGVVLADFHGAVTNGTSAAWTTGYAYDGLHPNAQGAAAMGRTLAAAMKQIVPPVDNLVTNNADTLALTVNSLMVGTTGIVATGVGTSGVCPASWTFDSAAGATVVGSKVARTDGKPGEWFQMDFQVSSGNYARLKQTNNISTVVAGGQYYAEVEFEADPTWVPKQTTLIMYIRNGAGTTATFSVASLMVAAGDTFGTVPKMTSGTLRTPLLTIPATDFSVLPLELRVDGTGKIRFGRFNVKAAQSL